MRIDLWYCCTIINTNGYMCVVNTAECLSQAEMASSSSMLPTVLVAVSTLLFLYLYGPHTLTNIFTGKATTLL